MRLPTSLTSTTRPREAGWRGGGRRLAFALVSAAIVAVVSERVFWFWTSEPVAHLELAAFYAIGTAPVLWLIDRYRVDRVGPLVLVALVFAMVIEGILTPVVFSGGPFVPVFPVWFTAWHGLMALIGAWYLLHRWLLDRRLQTIAIASALAGVFWGVWSMTLWLPENLEDEELMADGGPLTILGPVDFVRYTITFSLVLAAGHWVWGRLGDVGRFRPSRPAIALYLAGAGAMLIGWTVAYVWALPMFVAYVWFAVWFLRRHEPTAQGPSLLEQLVGPIRAPDLLAIAPLPVTASATYALIWWLAPTDTTGRVVMYGTILVQSAIAAVLLWRSVRDIRRRSEAQSSSAANDSNVPGVNSLS